MRQSSFLFVFCIATSATAQNLVPNPGFEVNRRCPGTHSRVSSDFTPSDWYSPNTGTPDAFNECARGEGGVPHNWAGVSTAWEGKGYAGIYVWLGLREFREYLQCKLAAPLIPDTTYQLSFRYKLSSYSKFAADRIGLELSAEPLTSQKDGVLSLAPDIQFVADSALTEKTGTWEKATYTFRAKGDERYLTIGNFANDADTKVYEIRHRPVQEQMLSVAAYYYVDDVILEPLYRDDGKQILPSFQQDRIALNERYVLDNILFDFASYRLLPASFGQLDEVLNVLQQHPDYKVRIAGHTDDVGSDRYNLELSRKRAESVAMFLAQAGVDRRRIEAQGYGKTLPVAGGTSEQARRVNRRVEVVFFR